MKKGDTLELEISKYASEGKGIAKINRSKIKPVQKTEDQNIEEENYVVFVHGSYPGDTVTARLRKIKNSYAEAKAIKIIFLILLPPWKLLEQMQIPKFFIVYQLGHSLI